MASKETVEYLKEAARLREMSRIKIRELTVELMKQKGISEAQARIEAKKNEEYKGIVNQLKEINSLIQEQKREQKELIDDYIQQESRLKGLTGLQASLSTLERKRIGIMSNNKIDEDKRRTFDSIASLQNDLLNTSAEDVVTQAEINRKLNAHYRELEGVRGIHSHIRKNLLEQRSIATDVSSLTEKQQDFLNKQLATYESMKTKIGGVLETLSLLLSNSTLAIAFSIRTLLKSIGSVVEKLGEVNQKLGTGFDLLNKINNSAALLSFVFDDAAGTVKEIASEFGDASKATFSLQTNIGLMADNFGISNSEAVSLVGSFARLNEGSTVIASNMIKTTQEFAKQNNIIPSTLLADLAQSSEEFSLYAERGGENLIRANAYALKLGTNLKSLTGLADNLLDFETSITKELELGALLGRNINLNKARELAYNRDIEGATKAVLKELGGVDAFLDMEYYQRKKTAELLGISTTELEKMVLYQESAAQMGSIINSEFSKTSEIIDKGVNKSLGATLKGAADVAGGIVGLFGSLAEMGFDIAGGLAKILGLILPAGVVGKILKDVEIGGGSGRGRGGGSMGGYGGSGRGGGRSRTRPAPRRGGAVPDSPNGFMKSLSKINMNAVLKGAAAMVIVAGAVFLLGKAMQEFVGIPKEDINQAIKSIGTLAGVVFLLSFAGKALLVGSAAMVIVASSVLILGKALQLMGTGFEMLSSGIAALTPQLSSVSTIIGGLVSFIPQISSLALYIGLLAASIIGLGIAGLLATPGIMLLYLLSKSFISVGNSFEMISGGISSLSESLREITKIISDLVLLIPSISLLALSIGGLSASLVGLGVAGLISAPGLFALSTVGAISTGIKSLFGSDEEGGESLNDNMNTLVTEIKGLRADLNSGKVAVYLDGKKVTASISREVERSTVNSYTR